MKVDYSQLQQKPIRLKPSIKHEKPSEATRRGPPTPDVAQKASTNAQERKARSSAGQWTLRGVSAEIREAVAWAAKEEGMTIGTWVDEVLRAVLTDDAETQPEASHEDAYDAILEAIEEIRSRLERLEERKTIWDTIRGFWS